MQCPIVEARRARRNHLLEFRLQPGPFGGRGVLLVALGPVIGKPPTVFATSKGIVKRNGTASPTEPRGLEMFEG